MLKKLDPNKSEKPNSSRNKPPPTRDWIAQIQTELASRSTSNVVERPYEKPPPAPSPTPRQRPKVKIPEQPGSSEPESPFPPSPERKMARKFDFKPNESKPNHEPINVKYPLTTSQSETHIQSRPVCARCHAPIHNIWERYESALMASI